MMQTRVSIWVSILKVSDISLSGVNFINVLHARFLYESRLSSSSLIMFGFVIFGAKILLMKLTAGVNFINMLTRSLYLHICLGAQLLFHQQYYAQLYQYTQREGTPNFYIVQSMLCTGKIIKNLQVQKAACKMLVKLTPVIVYKRIKACLVSCDSV
jgi:hypothetical protein